MLVKRYLEAHTFLQLEVDHGVCSRPSADFSKFGLNYDQFAIRPGDRLAEQCRGAVVRPLQRFVPVNDASWKDVVVGYVEVVAWPMDRFYNHGDPAGATIDWADPGLKAYEKLDGTMVVMYWDALKATWCAGTRSVCEADLPIKLPDLVETNRTFAELFWEAFKLTWNGDRNPDLVLTHLLDAYFDKQLTYVFELTGPHNRVVVRYDEPKATLLAVRCPATGQEYDVRDPQFSSIRLPRPATWSLNSIDDLVTMVDSADPAKLEGAVVVDPQFCRLKVKNKAWVLSSRAKDMVTTSPRSGLEAVIQERLDDILPLLDDDTAGKLRDLQRAYQCFCTAQDVHFQAHKSHANGDRKAFALAVTASEVWTPPMFAMWTGKASSTHHFLKDASGRGKLTDTSLDTILSKLTV